MRLSTDLLAPSRLKGVLPYEDKPASVWSPPIDGIQCLVLGFPWGPWDGRRDPEGDPELEWNAAELADMTYYDGSRMVNEDSCAIYLKELIRRHAAEDPSIWSWASQSRRTLIWLLTPPKSDGSLADYLMDDGSGRLVDILRPGASDLHETDWPKDVWRRVSAGSSPWLKTLRPFRLRALFQVHGDSPAAGSVASQAEVHSGPPGNEAELRERLDLPVRLGTPRAIPCVSGYPHVGPAIMVEMGQGCVVFLRCRHPESDSEVIRLRRAAAQIHEEVSRSVVPAEPARAHGNKGSPQAAKPGSPAHWSDLRVFVGPEYLKAGVKSLISITRAELEQEYKEKGLLASKQAWRDLQAVAMQYETFGLFELDPNAASSRLKRPKTKNALLRRRVFDLSELLREIAQKVNLAVGARTKPFEPADQTVEPRYKPTFQIRKLSEPSLTDELAVDPSMLDGRGEPLNSADGD